MPLIELCTRCAHHCLQGYSDEPNSHERELNALPHIAIHSEQPLEGSYCSVCVPWDSPARYMEPIHPTHSYYYDVGIGKVDGFGARRIGKKLWVLLENGGSDPNHRSYQRFLITRTAGAFAYAHYLVFAKHAETALGIWMDWYTAAHLDKGPDDDTVHEAYGERLSELLEPYEPDFDQGGRPIWPDDDGPDMDDLQEQAREYAETDVLILGNSANYVLSEGLWYGETDSEQIIALRDEQ